MALPGFNELHGLQDDLQNILKKLNHGHYPVQKTVGIKTASLQLYSLISDKISENFDQTKFQIILIRSANF